MQFTLHDVGLVHQATLKIEGLTILTGANGVGKSTITKALYCASALNPTLGNSDAIASAHDALIQSVFDGVYHHPDTAADCALLSLEQPTTNLNLVVEQGSTVAVQGQGYLPQPTLVLPPPALLVLYPTLTAQALNGLPAHWRHALHQLPPQQLNYQQPLAQSLEALLGGRLLFDQDRLVFQDQQDGLHPLATCSEGVQYLGALQLLLVGGTLTEGSMLCLEAPEAYLHPEWQLALAPVLTALAKAGVRVLLQTYSLTLLEALKAYSDRDGLEAATHFYWGEQTPQGSVFKSITEKLYVAFDSFSDPLVQLSRMGW